MDNDVPVLNILLAEDNPADVLLVREVLSEERIACTLHVMKDGEKAIKFIEGLDADPVVASLDMALLDMHLPKCDGEEILCTPRSTERYAQTPVVVMTASDAPGDYEGARKHAALHYFRKPSTLNGYKHLGGLIGEAAANARFKRVGVNL